MSAGLRKWMSAPGRGLWLALAGLTAVYAAVVIWRSSPESFYILDDPFIHLALAENLARGHFGVNMEEVANPSSSILWPWLMAGFQLAGFGVWAPLLVNVAAFLASAWLLIGFVQRHLAEGRRQGGALMLAGLVFLSVNVFGVIFTGMEHSLHVLASLVVVTRGVEKRYDRLMLVAMVVSPLIRFEGAAVLAFGLGAALTDKRWKVAAAALVGAAIPVVAYMTWLSSMGLPVLPSSVLVKAEGAGGVGGGVEAVWRNFANNLSLQSAWLAIAVLALAAWRRRGRDRVMALGLLAMLGLGLAFGPMRTIPRYEAYLLASVAAGALWVWRAEVRALTRSLPLTLALGLAVVAINFSFGMRMLTASPQAARNIHQQQHQMHRFVADCWRRPVAANDLGWLSYRNDAYVLDLWGLGSEEARLARLEDAPGWMATIVDKHGVEAALIYSGWFGDDVPASWVRVGELRITETSVSPAYPVVDVYATRPEAAGEIARCLREIAPRMPEGSEARVTG